MSRIKTCKSKALRQFNSSIVIDGINFFAFQYFEMRDSIYGKKTHWLMRRKIGIKIQMNLLTNDNIIVVDTCHDAYFVLGVRNNRK